MIRNFVALMLCSLGVTAGAAEAKWYFDLPQAQAIAKKQNKLVLINFTGSDWCGWCMKLKKEVFLTPEFTDYARKNLVLVEIDQPRWKPLSQEQLNINSQIQEKYRAEGFPTLVGLSRTGQEVWRLGGYAALPVPDWLKMFDGLKTPSTMKSAPIGTLPQAAGQAQN